MKKQTYEIEFQNEIYEIRCNPLSYHFTQYLAGTKTTTIEESNKLVQEVITETKAEYLGSDKFTWSLNMVDLPNTVLAAWLGEIISNSQTKAVVKVKQLKN